MIIDYKCVCKAGTAEYVEKRYRAPGIEREAAVSPDRGI